MNCSETHLNGILIFSRDLFIRSFLLIIIIITAQSDVDRCIMGQKLLREYWVWINHPKIMANWGKNIKVILWTSQSFWLWLQFSESTPQIEKKQLMNRYKYVFILSLEARQKSPTCSSVSHAIICWIAFVFPLYNKIFFKSTFFVLFFARFATVSAFKRWIFV